MFDNSGPSQPGGPSAQEEPPHDCVAVSINGETFLLHRLSPPDTAVVRRYVAEEQPDDETVRERLRLQTTMAALSTAVARADRDRLRQALRRNESRGRRDALEAVRRLVERPERDAS